MMRITTWNMQGSTQQVYLGALIAQNSPDVICLQESGDMTHLLLHANGIAGFPGSLAGMYQNGTNIYSVVFWYNNVDANPRNSLAIMSRVTINAHGIHAPVPVPPHVYHPNNPRKMPWMTVNDGGNLITILSYHGPSSGTANACAYNNPQVAAISAAGGTWSVAGDFNSDPTNGAFVAPPAGAVVRGNHATQQGGGLLDYSITNAGPGYAFSATGNLLGASDHYPQNFIF